MTNTMFESVLAGRKSQRRSVEQVVIRGAILAVYHGFNSNGILSGIYGKLAALPL